MRQQAEEQLEILMAQRSAIAKLGDLEIFPRYTSTPATKAAATVASEHEDEDEDADEVAGDAVDEAEAFVTLASSTATVTPPSASFLTASTSTSLEAMDLPPVSIRTKRKHSESGEADVQ
mmetsp:Transcript_75804/g.126380  ORF Transcript_75804/g.126380 Transcript_75804/m.126380 type:complete len:120 (+) Transcript_75804:78-437(+)